MYKLIILEEEFNINVITDSLGYEVISIYEKETPLDDMSEKFQNVLKTFNALKKEEL
jgi:hypothetical protein